jgi:hypothetical protein
VIAAIIRSSAQPLAEPLMSALRQIDQMDPRFFGGHAVLRQLDRGRPSWSEAEQMGRDGGRMWSNRRKVTQ